MFPGFAEVMECFTDWILDLHHTSAVSSNSSVTARTSVLVSSQRSAYVYLPHCQKNGNLQEIARHFRSRQGEGRRVTECHC